MGLRLDVRDRRRPRRNNHSNGADVAPIAMPERARSIRDYLAARGVKRTTEAAPRKTAHERGYGHGWRKASKAFLRAHPLCDECRALGRIEPATVVDHVRPHRGDMRLFWDRDNWQPLCKHHHDRKTARGE